MRDDDDRSSTTDSLPLAPTLDPDDLGVTFTHLDDELFDESGVTKRDLVDYLDAMADRMVPLLRDRPLSTIRVRAGQDPFMQKNLPKHAPDWIATVSSWAQASRREVAYALCNDRRTLLWFGNQRAVEYHVPLFAGQDWEHPTHLVMDIDPPPGAPFSTVVQAALLVRQALTEAGLDGAVKTSGAKGVHIFVPVHDESTEDVAAATRALAQRAQLLGPELTTTAFVREERDGKVFLDATRAGGATVAACYSPRVRPGVPVSFPVAWDDLGQINPAEYTVRSVVGRLGRSDPWSANMPAAQRLPAELVAQGHDIPIARVAAMHAGKRRKRAATES